MPSYSSFPGFIIKSTTIAVDYWPKTDNNNITHYFLTHAHKDHTRNLDASWTGPSFYCSELTKKLIKNINEVEEEYAIVLEVGMTHVMTLGEDESFNVTLIDANHCPGAVMYLFEGYFGHVLATGDFRYCPEMFVDTPLSYKKIDICYLDNTFFNNKFSKIPSRQDALKEIIELICFKREQIQNVIFHFNLRILGKENLLEDLFDHFKTPILVSKQRYERLVNILKFNQEIFTTEYKEDTLIFVTDPNEEMPNFGEVKTIIFIEPSALHMSQVSRENKSFSQLYNDPKENYYVIPYTDHSSYSEIVEFVKKLKPKLLIPIVRKALPGDVTVSDLNELNQFLSTESLVDCHDKYRLILRNATSLRRSSRLNMIKIPNNNRRTLNSFLKARKTRAKKKIEYESDSSQTQSQSQENFENKVMDAISEEIGLNDKENITLSKDENKNNEPTQNEFININEDKWTKISDQVDIMEFEQINSTEIIKIENVYKNKDAEVTSLSLKNDKKTCNNYRSDEEFGTPLTSPSRVEESELKLIMNDSDITNKDENNGNIASDQNKPAEMECTLGDDLSCQTDRNEQNKDLNNHSNNEENKKLIENGAKNENVNIDPQIKDNKKRVINGPPSVSIKKFYERKVTRDETLKFYNFMEQRLRKTGIVMDEKNIKKNLIDCIFNSYLY